ncbi:MAG: STT3 domain-containing protein [Candidatus Nanoarchaeia archaeon]|jgi:asparagine N-glycosylation enzyme membrane subunit Stt3
MAKKEKKTEKKEDDDSIEIDLSGIKNFFSGKKKGAEKAAKKEDEDDFELDLSGIKNWYLKNKKFTYPLTTLLLILTICFVTQSVRVNNIPNLEGKNLIELDSYLFTRYANYIINNSLPTIDTMRYYPTGFQTNSELLAPSYTVAFYYKIFQFFGSTMSVTDVAIIYPVISIIIGMIFFFLFVRNLFNQKIAFVSSLILVFLPGFLLRTSAGFVDKESIAMFFVFGFLYFISKTLKQEKIPQLIIYSLLSGLFLMGSVWSWGGVNIVLIPLGITFILSIFFNISKRRHSILYTILTLSALLFTFISPRYGTGFSILQNYMFLLFPVSLLLNLYYYELSPKISKYFIKYKPQKLPEHFYTIFIGIVLLLLITPFYPGIGFYQKVFTFIENQFLNPMGGDAFSRSVSENQEPYFVSSSGVDWWSGLNYVFFTMMIGSFFLFYTMLKNFPKQRFFYSILYILIVLVFIFSRFSDSQDYSSFNSFFNTRIFGLELHYVILSIFLIYTLYFVYKHHNKINEFSQINMEYLWLFIWFFLSIVVARGAVRLIFIVCPVAAILSGYAFEALSKQLNKIIKSKNISYGIIAVIFALILFFNFNISYNSNKNFYSSVTTEWNDATDWMLANTTEDSVFTHWWDYGYWVQGMGNRATTLDGGNYYVDRDHLIGRYLFASRIYQNGTYDMSEPATYLTKDSGSPDYFLILDDDVLKFVQMGRIGKRPVYYTVGTFSEEIDNQLNLENSTIFTKLLTFNSIYGAYPVQEDFVYNNFIFKKESTYILSIIYPYNPTDQVLGQPYAYVYNPYIQNQAVILPFNGQCFVNEGCITYKTDSVREYPLLLQDGVVLITENASDNLFTYLYLLNMSVPGFKLAYDNERPLGIQGMVSQSLTDIKIYSINYTELEPFVLNETLPNYWTTSGDAFW